MHRALIFECTWGLRAEFLFSIILFSALRVLFSVNFLCALWHLKRSCQRSIDYKLPWDTELLISFGMGQLQHPRARRLAEQWPSQHLGVGQAAA
mmetsp:Transcript_83185/g.150078  ORF Transcript_83185/g.150078 Transcript_83185/m.150078 type:complete len:94 (+) Transcript_83185:1216-1497(+)